MKEYLLKFFKSQGDTIIPTTFKGLYDILYEWDEIPLKETKFNTVIKELSDNPNIVFGGSISLKALGLLDRHPKDIDVFVNKDYSISNLRKSFTLEETEIASETTTDINGVEIKRIGLKLDGVKVCVFFVEDNSYSTAMYEGIKIRVQSCNSTIQAKKAYIKNGGGDVEKHKQDLKVIAEKLFNSDFEIKSPTIVPFEDFPF